MNARNWPHEDLRSDFGKLSELDVNQRLAEQAATHQDLRNRLAAYSGASALKRRECCDGNCRQGRDCPADKRGTDDASLWFWGAVAVGLSLLVLAVKAVML